MVPLARYWSVGNFGCYINDLALVFLLMSLIFSPFPMMPKPSRVDMKWAGLMFGAWGVLATANAIISAKRGNIAPVSLVKQD
jgi:hypothetical protein